MPSLQIRERDPITEHLLHQRRTWVLTRTLWGIVNLKFWLIKCEDGVLLSINPCVFGKCVGFQKPKNRWRNPNTTSFQAPQSGMVTAGVTLMLTGVLSVFSRRCHKKTEMFGKARYSARTKSLLSAFLLFQNPALRISGTDSRGKIRMFAPTLISHVV